MTDNITITLTRDEWQTVLDWLVRPEGVTMASLIAKQIPEEGQAEYDDATQGVELFTADEAEETKWETCECPNYTPWGHPDQSKELAPGIWSVSTASHGGIYLSPQRLGFMPAIFVNAGFIKANTEAGWFEEDCDWAMVALIYPEAFATEIQDDIGAARIIMKFSHADVLARWDGRTAAETIEAKALDIAVNDTLNAGAEATMSAPGDSEGTYDPNNA